MIDTTIQTQHHGVLEPRKVLTMVKNERMGGTIPKWSAPETAKDQIEQNLELATYDTSPASSFQSALADHHRHHAPHGEEFGFGDLVDMINPLQHVPVVSHLYREVTGDDIKPIGRIIGGAVFGGPVGAASSLVNTVVEEETGDDIAGNVTSMVISENTPTASSNSPEKRLEQAQDIAQQAQDLPASLLSFTDTNKTNFRAERFTHFKNLHEQSINQLSKIPETTGREEITKLAAFTMPK